MEYSIPVMVKKCILDLKRNLFKSSDNTGFIIEIFPSKQVAGSNLDVLKAMQSLKEQAMAKVSVLEGTR